MSRFRSPKPARFRTRGNPRQSGRTSLFSWWNLWRVPTLVTIVAAIWWFGVRPITHEQGWVPVRMDFSVCGQGERTTGCVVDGDTLRVDVRGQRPRRIRLTGFDTPELDGACEAERQLADQARQAVAAWLAKGPFEWNGADDPPYDQYGRELREIRRKASDGSAEYLGETLIDAGLADPSGWGELETDWCR
ncbi:MAG: hypothetical protein AAFN04_11420 [Pseudomonadota bacterium]